MLLAAASVLSLFLCSVLYAQNAPQPQMRDIAFKGKFDRLSGEVKLSGPGVGTVKEARLETAFATLERKGFTEESLERLRIILSNTYQGGEDVSGHKPTAADAIVEVKERGPNIEFKVTNEDLPKFNTFQEALSATTGQKGCEQISTNCVRCPDGKIYCFLVNVVE